ncbi:MAG: helix-turn-helix domain-containing protein [Acutalibacteraceae bacterium]
MAKGIGDLLTMYRKKLELTQREVAEALNIDRSTYTCYEIGKTEPNIETISRLAKIFNVSVVDLFPTDDNAYAQAAEFGGSGKIAINKLKFYDLNEYEKQIIMKIRQMSIDDKIKLQNILENDFKIKEE